MSEIGTEAVQATISTTKTLLSAMAKFIEWLMEAENRRINKELAKARALEAKGKLAQGKAGKKLDHSPGYVAAAKLRASGGPLEYINTTMGRGQMERFQYLAKRQGLAFSSTETISAGGETFQIIVRKKDLSLVKSITDRMSFEALSEGKANDKTAPMHQWKDKIDKIKGRKAGNAGKAPDTLKAVPQAGNKLKPAPAPALAPALATAPAR
ncbi:MAG: DUF3801 domain-containing protein [Lachnospiraceae bacterium]|nr:DUF3801 domain-containing protein [Lachnospiraceae bacterium]